MKHRAHWTNGTNATDRRLSGLTPRQSQRVRDLARTALAERGLEAIVHADHLRTVDGRAFGLNNLASLCHNAPQAHWPQLVAAHLGAILEACPQVPPILTVNQIRDGAHLRLAHTDAMADMGEDAVEVAYRYARHLGGGWLELIAHVDGSLVRWLRDCEVEQVGVDPLRALALERLLRIRPEICAELRGPDCRLFSIRGESGFIASKLLVLPEVMRLLLPRRSRCPFGVLVAVPTRHQLTFAPVGRDVVPNLAALISHTLFLHTQGQAPLSPHVYWWRDGQLTQLTEVDPRGQIQVRFVAEFIDVVDDLLSHPDVA